ncbi:MAG: NDP-sugar synthase [Candidatus Binatia bacterium]
MHAVILAAGRGSRMGALTATKPKPMLPLKGRPIIEHILRGLTAAGVRDVVIVTGYRGEQIAAHLGDGSRCGIRLAYRHQLKPEGTARALLLARDVVARRPFLLTWGDVVVAPGNYAALVTEFRRLPCEVLLMVNAADDPWRGAAVYMDGQWRVTQLVEKPPQGGSQTHWNNAGIFVCTPRILTYAERVRPSPRGEYELPQAIAGLIAAGGVVRAHPVQGFWGDLGTPEDLAVAERAFTAEDGR